MLQKGEPMNDLISRQAAIDTLENTKTAISENGERYIAKQNAIMRIDALPSAEPKRGWWIEIINSRGMVVALRCSRCEKSPRHGVRSDFCPNCGARMEVEDE